MALVPWLLVVSRTHLAVGALSGLFFAVASGMLANGWVPGTLEALGASSLGGTLGAAVAVLLGRGLPWMCIGVVAAAAGRVPHVAWPLALAAAFIAADVASQALPLGIPWEALGHSQAPLPGVAQLAVLGGVPLISGLLAALNGSLALLLAGWRTESRATASRWTAMAVGAYLAAAWLGLPAAQWARTSDEPRERLDLLLVQPDIPPGERWMRSVQRTNLAIMGLQTQAALEASESPPDLVIWPETVLTNPIDADDALRKDLLAWVDRLGVPVVLGAVRSARSGEPRHYRNSVLRVEPERGVTAAFDKTTAIPVVESTAFPGGRVLGAAMGLPALERSVEAGVAEHPLRGSPPFAVAVCFEALYPGLVASRRDSETAAILVLANDSWFASDTPSRKHLAFSSFRAIEQRLWLLRVAHGGISAVVDPFGRVVSELAHGTRGTLTASVTTAHSPTSGERLAMLLVLVAGAASGRWLAIAASRRLP